MKKPSIASLFLSSLVALSLFCYVYLQNAGSNSSSLSTSVTEMASSEVEAGQESGVFLPDFTLAKRLVNITKMVVPKD
jgi:hypothetical protein